MNNTEIIKKIKSSFKNITIDENHSERIISTPKEWEELSKFLRNDYDLFFDSMMCITGIDEGIDSNNLGIVYNLHSMKYNHKIEVYVPIDKKNPKIFSVEKIWRMAEWFEREAYDMYGIIFDGHSDLRRILLPDDWDGFPLRKDYQFPKTWHGIVVDKIKDGWE